MEKMVIYGFFGLFAILILVRVGVYLIKWNEYIRYLKMEVRRAPSKNEYKRWKRALWAARLSIIPGVTPHSARKFLKKLGK